MKTCWIWIGACVVLASYTAQQLAAEETSSKNGSEPVAVAESSFATPQEQQEEQKEQEQEEQEQESSESEDEKSKTDESLAKQLEKLESDYRSATAEWRNKLSDSETTDEQRRKLLSERPAKAYGEQLVAFAKEHSGTPEAREALIKAVGFRNIEAMQMLLDFPEEDLDSKENREIVVEIARSGIGEPQKQALSHLLTLVERNPDSDESFEWLKIILQARGSSEAKTAAIEMIEKMIEEDISSERAVEGLILLAKSDNEEASRTAKEKLVEHHINDQRLIPLVNSMARDVSEGTYQFLETLCENAEGEVKANAILAMTRFLSTRNTYANFYKNASEEQLEALGEERAQYLLADHPETQKEQIEQWLSEFESDDEDLVERAKNELFALRHLAIGKTAPEIEGRDLDGKKFKLSDYRGKVVFLDFWGDW